MEHIIFNIKLTYMLFEPYIWAAIIILPIYFIPTVIAMVRKHDNRLAIIVLNVVAGWTFVGYVAALVWSLLRTSAVARTDSIA